MRRRRKAMSDNKVLVDEARRTAEHQRVRSRVQREVDTEIEAAADRPVPEESRVVQRAGARLRGHAVDEALSTEREVSRGRKTARIAQFVDYVFWLVYGLLAIRLVLALIGARPGAGFVQAIQAITDPLYAPFRGILPNLTADGGYTLVLPLLFAIFMYLLLHFAVRGLLRLIGERRSHI